MNNWNFGKESIDGILGRLINSGMDIIELGFLRKGEYDESRTVFPGMQPVRDLLKGRSRSCKYALMAEAAHQIDVTKLEEYSPEDVDYIRVITWKNMHDDNGVEIDAIQDGYEYCKAFVDKGYQVCINPARVEQYSDEEFRSMLMKFSELSPWAIYVVDSWGTMYTDEVLHYMHIADEILPQEISLGFHGHNNMMQVFAIAEALIKESFRHELIIDASVYGMGRGAGNLNTELIARYMNNKGLSTYGIEELLNVYEDYLKRIYTQYDWGYSLPMFVTADYHANPSYGSYYDHEKKLAVDSMVQLIKEMTDVDKVVYSKSNAEKFLDAFYRQHMMG